VNPSFGQPVAPVALHRITLFSRVSQARLSYSL